MKPDLETLRKKSLEATLARARKRRMTRRAGIAAAWMLPAFAAAWLAFRAEPVAPVVVITPPAPASMKKHDAPTFERVRSTRESLTVFKTSATPVPRVTTEQLADIFPNRGIVIIAQESGPSRIEIY